MKTGQEITFTLNSIKKSVFVRTGDTLLYVLRSKIGLMGAKPGCHNGDCGACTVLVDGVPLNACHLLAVETVGKKITTIEGLSNTVVQDEFIKQWAVQCGYCTPGFILNCYALITSKPNADEATIDEWLDSNICRCTGYQEIKNSVKNLLQMGQANG